MVNLGKKRAWFAGGVALLVGTPALASGLDLTPTTERGFGDPTYRLRAGEVSGSTSASTTVTTSHSRYPYDGRTDTSKNRAYQYGQSVGVGVTDSVSLGLSGSYYIAHTDAHSSNGWDASSRTKGFTDPTLSGSYRAIDQSFDPVNLDIGLSYTPPILPSKFNTDTSTGTPVGSGHSFGLSAGISRQMKALSVWGNASINHTTPSSADIEPAGTQSKSGPTNVGSIAVGTRLPMTEIVAANFSAGYSTGTDYRGSSASSTYTTHPGDSFTVSAGLDFTLIPNQLVSSIDYSHGFAADGQTDSGINSREDRSHYDRVMFVLSYKFAPGSRTPRVSASPPRD